MKKTLPLLLALMLCLSLCACQNDNSCNCDCSYCRGGEEEKDTNVLTQENTNEYNNSNYIGVWQYVGRNEYMYIYEDGTGDHYGDSGPLGWHYNHFTWEIEGDYLVKHGTNASGGTTITKYTFDKDCLLNSQKKIAFIKHSNDTTVDVE